jgi:eukaryotic-like serine/threonine-protein kinase
MAIHPGDWARVRDVFEHAVELPPADRQAYIAAECGTDAALRAQVLRMLDSHGRAAAFLETPAAVLLDETSAVRLLEGQRIGPYRLVSRIGEGGMGEVYKAVDTRLDRTVAIKVLPERVAHDRQARERFDRERRAIAALNHPHICALYDVGEATVAGDESMASRQSAVILQFLVMELLEGETLAARIARGPLPLAEACEYARQIASALDKAHRAGIVHRDLKPGNIFLVPSSGTAAAFATKLLDFGLAKTEPLMSTGASNALPGATELTTPGMILGTVQYMAPEQIEGRETDARTDVFAFGAVLFEMITGRKAFEAVNQASLMVAILDREPPRLSSLMPLAPPWLESLVGRCLEKNPDKRWQSAQELMIELQSDHDSVTPTATARSVRTRVSAAPWRKTVLVSVVVAIAAIAAVSSPVALRRWLNPSAPAVSARAVPKASLAVLPIRPIDSPEAEADHFGVGIADAIVTRLANIQALRVRPTSATVSFEGRSIDPEAAGHELQVDYALTGTVRRVGDAYRFNLQMIRVSDGVLAWGRQIDVSRRDLFAVEDQVSAEVVSALQVQISAGERARLNQRFTQNPDAYDEYLQGRALLARYSDSNLRQAMNHFERALTIDPADVLAESGLAMAAGIFSVRYAYEPEAREWGRRAEEYAERALKRDASLAESHLALAGAAGTLYRNFDWPTVIREAQAALSLNPNLDLAHSALARAFFHIGLLDRSDVETRRAEDASGGTNVEVSRVHVYNELLAGRYEEARRRAETLLTRTDAPVIRQYLGLAMFYGGDRVKGQELLAGVRRPDGRMDTRSQASLAGVLAANGRRDDAERAIRGVLDSGYMDHHVAYGLGVAEAQLGRPAAAIKWLRTAAETGFPCYPWIDRDPLVEPIRSDRAFQEFLAAVRMEYDHARTQFAEVVPAAP